MSFYDKQIFYHGIDIPFNRYRQQVSKSSGFIDKPRANDNKSSKRELTILLSVLAVLVILVFRPFGLRLFLKQLEIGNVYSLLLIISIVGILLVILQRLGIIFNENYAEYR